MRYTVVWTKAAENQLAFYWTNTSQRNAISEAANRIDRDLRNDPDQKVVPYEEFHLYRVSPLAVLLRIVPDDRIVQVIQVLPFE